MYPLGGSGAAKNTDTPLLLSVSSFFPSFIHPVACALLYRFTLDLNSGIEMNAVIAVLVKKLYFSSDVIY